MKIIWKKECVHMYDWVTLLYSRNWHNMANQLYFNTIFNKKEKKKPFLNIFYWRKKNQAGKCLLEPNSVLALTFVKPSKWEPCRGVPVLNSWVMKTNWEARRGRFIQTIYPQEEKVPRRRKRLLRKTARNSAILRRGAEVGGVLWRTI